MSRFVEQAIVRAGLGLVLERRRSGDLEGTRQALADPATVDLLILGAIADLVRVAETDDVVRVHPTPGGDVVWVPAAETELELIRSVAITRITGPIGARVGVDWGRTGLELAQVALGFGATDLTGPITRKNGLLISEDDLRKVKGKGMVAATALKRREIAALIANAGRTCVFTDEHETTASAGATTENAHA